MKHIFLSYRRDDAQGWASHLSADIQAAFGVGPLFFDLFAIQPGEDFTKAIERALSDCRVLLALIGPRWLAASYSNGKRRLDDPSDLVRREISIGLGTPSLTVIPVLLGDTKLPAKDSLPAELAQITKRNAFELSDKRWGHDCNLLLATLEQLTGLSRKKVITSRSPVSVLENAKLEDVEIGDVTGIKSEGSYESQNGETSVAKGATIRRAKLGDIVGVAYTGRDKKD